MTGTPPSFADTPAIITRSGDGPDLLSEVLRTVRLTGSVIFGGSFTAPFAVRTPKRWDEGTPFARLHHISVFHLIVEGACTFETACGKRREVTAGDVLLMPFADQHTFWNGDPPEIAYAPDIIRPGPIEGMVTARYGGGGEETRIACGFLESSECLFAPVFRTLPPLLVDRTDDDTVGALIASTVREIVTLVDAGLLRSTIRSWAARSSSCTPRRPGAGPRRTSHAKPAPHAPCWPSASTRSWASHRSNM